MDKKLSDYIKQNKKQVTKQIFLKDLTPLIKFYPLLNLLNKKIHKENLRVNHRD